MIGFLEMLLGGIARIPRNHVARSSQGSKTAAGGECVPALVLDGEHDVIRCRTKKSRPSISSESPAASDSGLPQRFQLISMSQSEQGDATMNITMIARWSLLIGLIGSASLVPVRATSTADVYAPLRLYEGAWQVTQTTPAPKKPDRLINDCAKIGRYFACQQTVNGKPGPLVVFIPDAPPGHYHTQIVLPDGAALGPPGALTIAGDHWTYLGKPDAKGVRYRTINVFSGRDRIHFVSARSPDGKTWTVTMAGNEMREQ